MSIVINRPAEDVFAYLASEEHIAVLGQQLEYEQTAGEGGPEESRPQGESEMKDEGKVEDKGKRRPYIYIPIVINLPNAQLQEMRRLKDLLEGRPVPPRQRPKMPTIRGRFKLDVRARVVIKRPIEAFFAYISEVRPTRITPEMQQERVERVSRRFLGIFPYTEVHRQPAIKEIRQEPEGPIGVGTRFVRVATSRRVTYEQVTEISEYEPPRMIVFKLKMGRPQEGATGVVMFESGSMTG